MQYWTQEEIAEMRLADAEIEEDFCMTLEEIEESKERDNEAMDGQLDFAALRKILYNRAYGKRYYAANKEKLNARSRAYRAAHKTAENARSREWRERNSEYEKTWQRAYYEENRPFILAKKQARYAVDRAFQTIMRGTEAKS